MRTFIILVAVLFAVSAPAFAQSMTVEPTNLMGGDRYVDLTFELKNETGERFSYVVVECTFFDANGRALIVEKHIVSNVGSGSTVHDTLKARRIEGMETAGCRVGDTTN